MKKVILSIFLSVLIGLYLGKTFITQYDDSKELIPVFNNDMINLYFVKLGSFETKEEMEKQMLKLPYYIYDDTDSKYISYIGITSSLKNAHKIKGYYDNLGYITSIEEISISNGDFITTLYEYEKLLEESNDKTIQGICNQILSKYEELVNIESKN